MNLAYRQSLRECRHGCFVGLYRRKGPVCCDGAISLCPGSDLLASESIDACIQALAPRALASFQWPCSDDHTESLLEVVNTAQVTFSVQVLPKD